MTKRRGYKDKKLRRIVNRLWKIKRFPKKRPGSNYRLFVCGSFVNKRMGKIGAIELPPVDYAERHRMGWL